MLFGLEIIFISFGLMDKKRAEEGAARCYNPSKIEWKIRCNTHELRDWPIFSTEKAFFYYSSQPNCM